MTFYVGTSLGSSPDDDWKKVHRSRPGYFRGVQTQRQWSLRMCSNSNFDLFETALAAHSQITFFTEGVGFVLVEGFR